MLVVLLAVSGCKSETSEARNAVCQILITDSSPVEKFIQPKPGDVVHVNACRKEGNLYVVFLNHAHDTAVAYNVGDFRDLRLDVFNYGFGTLLSNGDWSLLHTNGQPGYFESQGGVATLQEISGAIQNCAKGKPLMQFNWPPSKGGEGHGD